MKRALMIFAKAPVAGFAKTRLIPSLGEDGAAELHAELCERTISSTVSPMEWDSFLWCAPDLHHPFFQQKKDTHTVTLMKQPDGDLGQKMAYAFEHTLKDYEQVVIVGTDCPAIGAARVRQAFAALSKEVTAVVNPAEDGGYVLLGLRAMIPDLFNDIQWGSDQVWNQTRHRLDTIRENYEVLESLWDVDDSEDLRRYQALAMV